MSGRRALLAGAACLLLTSTTWAADLPAASPAEGGLGRLDRITTFFKADTDSKRLPGAVVMIARHGKVVYHEAFGARDPATGAPMQRDSIFRIYSMTKPVTGVAVLMLMEEGKFRLSDPVSKYLPALKNPKVMVETVDAQGRRVTSTVPANREITIQDLMRHTSGITYGAGGTVNLIGRECNEVPGIVQHAWQLRGPGNAGDSSPGLEGFGPGGSILVSGQMIAAEVEEVADPVMGRQKTLCLPG